MVFVLLVLAVATVPMTFGNDGAALVAANGEGKMPAYKGKLADAEIQSLVVHMRTFAKQ